MMAATRKILVVFNVAAPLCRGVMVYALAANPSPLAEKFGIARARTLPSAPSAVSFRKKQKPRVGRPRGFQTLGAGYHVFLLSSAG